MASTSTGSINLLSPEANKSSGYPPLSAKSSVVPNYHSTNPGPWHPKEAHQPTVSHAAPTRCKYLQAGSFWDHFVYLCALSMASYAGVIIRIYLANTVKWSGVPLFASLYAEIVGTAMMGFVISHKKLLTGHKALYQAVATGLCGSITTFSSWNSEAAKVLLQVGRARPDNAERIIGWATILILGAGMPIAAMLFGKHVASLSPWSDSKVIEEDTGRCFRTHCQIAQKLIIVLAWICITFLVIFIPYHFQHYDLMFSCVFSFVGTYVRWHLAPLNSLIPNFKLGTFIVNVLGSWIIGSVAVVSTQYESEMNDVQAAVLKGLSTGFCGCLTTVSTFAVELSTLPLRQSYVYGFVSLALAQLGLVVIRGTYIWTQ